jgi:membrane fusion protein (multidrug efflux system)
VADQEAQSALAASQAGLEASRQRLKVLDAQVVEAEAMIAQAGSDLRRASLDLGYTEIRAPIEGYVGNRAARVGAFVSEGSYLLSIIPAHGLWIDANFKEDQLAHMAPGQPVSVAADVAPGRVFHGRVLSMAPGTGAVFSIIPPENATGNFTKIVQRVPVRIALDAADAKLSRLRPGLSALVSVDTKPAP